MASPYQQFADKHGLFYDREPAMDEAPLINDVFKTHKSHDRHLAVGHSAGFDIAVLERELTVAPAETVKLSVMALNQNHKRHFLLLGKQPDQKLKTFLGNSLLSYRVRKLAQNLFLMAKPAEQESLINFVLSRELVPQNIYGYYYEFLPDKTVSSFEIELEITAVNLEAQFQALIAVSNKLSI